MKQTKNLNEGLTYVSPSVKVKNLRARRAVMTGSFGEGGIHNITEENVSDESEGWS